MSNARHIAFLALRDTYKKSLYADVALHRWLEKQGQNLSTADRRLATELVYGCVRSQRTLDALIDAFATKPASQQPLNQRLILHLGLYQIQYLSRIPPSAAVNTTVELAKKNGLGGLKGFINGLLRQYLRQADTGTLPAFCYLQKGELDTVAYLGTAYSFPDWIVNNWVEQLGAAEAEKLCAWMNQSPSIDLRVNPQKATLEQVQQALQTKEIPAQRVTIASGDRQFFLPQALRLQGSIGAIQALPGYSEGWWSVQDSSAQLVTHLLNPQPGETVVDACAPPGGKTGHIAELIGDRGTVWAIVKPETKHRQPGYGSQRSKRLQENLERLQVRSVKIELGDSRNLPQFQNQAHRVLVDAPCSGLGTLHRRVDARWRQQPGNIPELAQLQSEILTHAATWVKPGGVLVYATCTVHPLENESVLETFLAHHPQWEILPPDASSPLFPLLVDGKWMKVFPHRHHMDGFFMARLQKKASGYNKFRSEAIAHFDFLGNSNRKPK
jgi:16S rRNA (cytosine967-C5)-methyltransferase